MWFGRVQCSRKRALHGGNEHHLRGAHAEKKTTRIETQAYLPFGLGHVNDGAHRDEILPFNGLKQRAFWLVQPAQRIALLQVMTVNSTRQMVVNSRDLLSGKRGQRSTFMM